MHRDSLDQILEAGEARARADERMYGVASCGQRTDEMGADEAPRTGDQDDTGSRAAGAVYRCRFYGQDGRV